MQSVCQNVNKVEMTTHGLSWFSSVQTRYVRLIFAPDFLCVSFFRCGIIKKHTKCKISFCLPVQTDGTRIGLASIHQIVRNASHMWVILSVVVILDGMQFYPNDNDFGNRYPIAALYRLTLIDRFQFLLVYAFALILNCNRTTSDWCHWFVLHSLQCDAQTVLKHFWCRHRYAYSNADKLYSLEYFDRIFFCCCFYWLWPLHRLHVKYIHRCSVRRNWMIHIKKRRARLVCEIEQNNQNRWAYSRIR